MMIRNAKKNLTIVTTGDGLNRKFESLKTAMEQARKKGVSIKIAAPISMQNQKIAKDLAKVGDIRSGKVKARFVISDDKEMMFMILDDNDVHPNYDTGIWINSSFFAEAMGQIFNTSWENMTPLNKLKL